MSVFKYGETNVSNESSQQKKEFKKVGYFKLANDGDEALVRFAYSDPTQFDCATVHSVKTKSGRYSKVVCLKESRFDDNTKCPLCAAGNKVSTKFFVKMVTYETDASGQKVAVPVIWDRPYSFTTELAGKVKMYGDLKQVLFKVTRHGKAGDMSTTYTVEYAPPVVYKQEMYPMDFSAFEHFDLAKHSYYVKNDEEIRYFLSNGDFPETVKVEESVTPVTPPQSFNDPFAEPRRNYYGESAARPTSSFAYGETKEEPTKERPVRQDVDFTI